MNIDRVYVYITLTYPNIHPYNAYAKEDNYTEIFIYLKKLTGKLQLSKIFLITSLSFFPFLPFSFPVSLHTFPSLYPFPFTLSLSSLLLFTPLISFLVFPSFFSLPFFPSSHPYPSFLLFHSLLPSTSIPSFPFSP